MTATPSLNIEKSWLSGIVIASIVNVWSQFRACSWTFALVFTKRFATKLYIFFASKPNGLISGSKILLSRERNFTHLFRAISINIHFFINHVINGDSSKSFSTRFHILARGNKIYFQSYHKMIFNSCNSFSGTSLTIASIQCGIT